MPQPRATRILAVGLVLALALVACTGDEAPDPDASATASPSPGGTTGPGTAPTADASPSSPGPQRGPDTPAAALRARTTAILQEHVHLVGLVAHEALANGVDSRPYALATGVLEGNTRAFVRAVGQPHGRAVARGLLRLWRVHIDLVADYTVARASGNAAAADEARAGLDTFGADVGTLLADANPSLPRGRMANALGQHVDLVLAAIDGLAGDGTDPFAALADASAATSGMATTLADGIAGEFPEDYPGTVDSDGATLRATLTSGLQEHVHLAGTAILVGVRYGFDSARFELARAAVDANAVALSETVGAVHGERVQARFLSLWQGHVDDLVAFATARIDDDQRALRRARAGFDEFRAEVGALFADVNQHLPAVVVGDELALYRDAMTALVDALLTEDGDPYTALQDAAAIMPGTAATLSSAIAAKFPDPFSS